MVTNVARQRGGSAEPDTQQQTEGGTPSQPGREITPTDRSESEINQDLRGDSRDRLDYLENFNRELRDPIIGINDPDLKAAVDFAANPVFTQGSHLASGRFLPDGGEFSPRTVGSFAPYGQAQVGNPQFQQRELDKVLTPEQERALEREAAQQMAVLLDQGMSLADIEYQLASGAAQNSVGHQARVQAEMKRLLIEIKERSVLAHRAIENDDINGFRDALKGASQATMILVHAAYPLTFTGGREPKSLEQHSEALVKKYLEEEEDQLEQRSVEVATLLNGFGEQQASQMALQITEIIGDMKETEGFNLAGALAGGVLGLHWTMSGAGNYRDLFKNGANNPGVGEGLLRGAGFGFGGGFRWTEGLLNSAAYAVLGSGIQGYIRESMHEDEAHQLIQMMEGLSDEQKQLVIARLNGLEINRDHIHENFRESALRDLMNAERAEPAQVDLKERASNFLHNHELLTGEGLELTEEQRIQQSALNAVAAFSGLTKEQSAELKQEIARQQSERHGVLAREEQMAATVVTLLESQHEGSSEQIQALVAGLPSGARRSLEQRVVSQWNNGERTELTEDQLALLRGEQERAVLSEAALRDTASRVVTLVETNSPAATAQAELLLRGVENRDALLEAIHAQYGTSVGPMNDESRERYRALVENDVPLAFVVPEGTAETFEDIISTLDDRVQEAVTQAAEGFDPAHQALGALHLLHREPAFLKDEARQNALDGIIAAYRETEAGKADTATQEQLEQRFLEESEQRSHRILFDATEGLNATQREAFVQALVASVPERGEGDFFERLQARMPLTLRFEVNQAFTQSQPETWETLNRSVLYGMDTDQHVLIHNTSLRERDLAGFRERDALLERTRSPIEAEQLLQYMAGRDESVISAEAQAARDRLGEYYDVIGIESDPTVQRGMRENDPRFRDLLANDRELAALLRRDSELYEAYLQADPSFREAVLRYPSDRKIREIQVDLRSTDSSIREAAAREHDAIRETLRRRDAVLGGDAVERAHLLADLRENAATWGGFDYPEASRVEILESDPRYVSAVASTPGLAEVLENNRELREAFREADPDYRAALLANPQRQELLLAASPQILAELRAHPWSQGAADPAGVQWIALELARTLGVNAWKRSEAVRELEGTSSPREVIDTFIGGKQDLTLEQRDEAARAIIRLNELQYGRGVTERVARGYLSYAEGLNEATISQGLSELENELPYLYSLALENSTSADREAFALARSAGVNAWARAEQLNGLIGASTTTTPEQLQEVLFAGMSEPSARVAALQTVLAVHGERYGAQSAQAFIERVDPALLQAATALEVHQALTAERPSTAQVSTLAASSAEELQKLDRAHALVFQGTSEPTFRKVVADLRGMPQEQISILDKIDGSDPARGAESLKAVFDVRASELATLRKFLAATADEGVKADIENEIQELLREQAEMSLHILTRFERSSDFPANHASTLLFELGGKTVPADEVAVQVLVHLSEQGTSSEGQQQLAAALTRQQVGALSSFGEPREIITQIRVARLLNRIIETPKQEFDGTELQALHDIAAFMNPSTDELYALAYHGDSLREKLQTLLENTPVEVGTQGATKEQALQALEAALGPVGDSDPLQL